MGQVNIPLPQARFGQTTRRDAWWLPPLLTFLGFSAFIVYSTWAAFQGKHYHFDLGGANYLSPFYSPLLFDAVGINSGHAWFGQPPGWLTALFPSFIGFSPALLILWAPGGFRFTCYYYRGAYYKAFWADPPGCAVGEPRKKYLGESAFPLILQNVHRYFLYLALAFLALLLWDAVQGFRFADYSKPGAGRTFGIGVGSLVLLINPILLGSYTLGCHSLRHIVGGKRDCISSCSAARQGAYSGVSCLNRRHMLFAWLSLFWVGFTDVYVRMCSMGVWEDLRLL
jgi:hypothetical protein